MRQSKKILTISILILLVAASFISLVYADAIAPVFDNLSNYLGAAEDNNYTRWICAHDAGEDYPLHFSDDSESKLSVFNMQSYNTSCAMINFTPLNTDVLDLNANISNYHVSIIVKDNLFNTNVQDVLVNITNTNDPPNITGYTPSELESSIEENSTVGFTFNYTASDPDLIHPGLDYLNNTWFYDSSIMTYNISWGYLPGFCDAGIHNITLIVNDSYGATNNVSWNITVNNTNRIPVLNNSIGNITWQEDSNLTNNITLSNYFYDDDYNECSGSNKDTLNYTVYGNTSITVEINQNTFQASFYPNTNHWGTATIYFTLNDTHNTTNSNNITLNITPVNDAPILSPIAADQTWYTGIVNNMTITASDVENDTLYFYTNDTLFNVTNTSSNTGIINLTPTIGDIGVYFVNISVNDSEYQDSQIVQFTIADNNAPVIGHIGGRTATQGVLFTLYLNATDADLDNVTFSSNTSFFIITTVNNSGALAVGVANFTPEQANIGNYTIEITATDVKGAKGYHNMSFNASDTSYAPVLSAIPDQEVRTNQSHQLDVSAYASDTDGDILYYWTNSSIFTINASTGIINFTANSSMIGVRYINISVNDTVFHDSQIVTYTIADNNIPAINALEAQTAEEDSVFSMIIAASDADGDTLTFDSNTSMFNFTSYNSTAVKINFTPTQTDIGNYSILVNVSDSYNGYNQTILYLNITEFNDIPYFTNLESATLTEGNSTEIWLTAYDEEGTNLTFSDNSSMFNISWYNETMALINFTPQDQDAGNHTINFTVSDGVKSNSTFVVYEVLNVNSAPTIDEYHPNTTNVSVKENSSIYLNVTASDADAGDSLFYNWTFNGTNRSSTLSLNYSAGFCDADNYNLTVYVSDLFNNVTTHFWNFTVNNTNRIPVLNNSVSNITWQEDSNLTNNITLSNYFFDDDYNECSGSNKDTLTYTVHGNTSITVEINQNTFQASFYPNTNHWGTTIIYFTINDTHNTTNSNNITLNITAVNDAPVLARLLNRTYNSDENVTIRINATDTENDTLYYWTNSSIFTINPTTGLVNFIVTGAMVGNHTINFTVNDTELSDSMLVVFSINGTNTAPNITNIYPYGTPLSDNTIFAFSNATNFPGDYTSINASENQSILFNHTNYDAENASLTYKWYLDSVLQATTSSYVYDIGFSHSGNRNITIEISDNTNTDSFTWNVTVSNTNRNPWFGIKKHTNSTEFQAGTDNQTNTTEQPGNVTIAMQNSTHYYANGTFLSQVIDFGDDITKPQAFTASWTETKPSGTYITLQTRVGDTVAPDSSWSNWSKEYTNSTSSTINHTNSRYLQYMANLSTSDTSLTPVLEEVWINYGIANYTMNEDNIVNSWVDLDDYFFDDTDETLNFSYSNILNSENLGISINNNTHIASINPTANWYGTAELRFWAIDQYNETRVYSNNITVTVSDVADQSYTIVSGGGGGGGATYYIPILEEKLTYLELIVPKLIIAEEEKITALIKVKNNKNTTLQNVLLTSSTTESGVTFKYSKEFFKLIEPNMEYTTNLSIFVKGKPKAFQVNVSASVETPEFYDSAVIFVSALPFNITTNETVKFVRDLLSTNPECLELNEFLNQAQKLISEGQYEKAQVMLSEIIESCKYLISARAGLEKKTPRKGMLETIINSISSLASFGGVGIILFIFVIAAIVLVLNGRFKKKPRKKKKKR